MPRVPRRTPKHGKPAMSDFNDGFRSLFIVVRTPDGTFAMYLMTALLTAMHTEARRARHG